MKIRKCNPRILLLSSLLIVFASISSESLSAWRVAKNAVNVVSTPGFGIDILEDYAPPESGVTPGVDVKKVVNIKNIGDSSSIIRVKLTKQLGHKVGSDFVESESLDLGNLLLNTDSEKWVLKDDGYFYYSEVLKAGETTDEPVLSSFKLKETANEEYKNLDGHVIVNAESIQYEGNALKLWGMSYADLGLKEPISWFDSGISTVEFLNNGTDFDINLSENDLFRNFKGLLPGTTRTQEIKIMNNCDDSADIKLVQLKTVGLSEETVKELLTKYVFVKIEDMATSEVLYEGSLGTENGIEINFGDFASGQVRNLKVTCIADEKMPNTLQNIEGHVEWSFVADEVSKPIPTGVDADLPWVNIAIFIVGLSGSIYFYRKVRNEDESV